MAAPVRDATDSGDISACDAILHDAMDSGAANAMDSRTANVMDSNLEEPLHGAMEPGACRWQWQPFMLESTVSWMGAAIHDGQRRTVRAAVSCDGCEAKAAAYVGRGVICKKEK